MQFINRIEDVVKEYIHRVARELKVDESKMLEIWGSIGVGAQKTTATVKTATNEPIVEMDNISLARLTKCNLNELKALCRDKGLKVGGKKDDLVSRLLEFAGGEEEEKTVVPKTVATRVKKTPEVKIPNVPVIKKVMSSIPVISVSKNSFGNLEHPESRLVFENKKVVGRQKDDGSIDRCLTDEDVQNCKKFKFDYTLPENLDAGEEKRAKTVVATDDFQIVVEDSDEDDSGDDEDVSDTEEDDE